MSLTHPDTPVSQQDLKDFYGIIKPYMGIYPTAITNKFSKGDLYSTDEKMIGQWQDGRPLYQKTYVTPFPQVQTFGTLTSIVLDSDTTKRLKMAVGSFEKSDGQAVPIPIYGWANDKLIQVSVKEDSEGIKFRSNHDDYNNDTAYITLQYTKTTDSAVSIGNDTDYSTTEKIVGTWITGEPIYQKTIVATVPTTSANYTYALTSIDSDLTHKLISYEGLIIMQDGQRFNLPQVNSTGKVDDNCDVCTKVTQNSAGINLMTSFVGYGGSTAYITIKYTKTS